MASTVQQIAWNRNQGMLSSCASWSSMKPLSQIVLQPITNPFKIVLYEEDEDEVNSWHKIYPAVSCRCVALTRRLVSLIKIMVSPMIMLHMNHQNLSEQMASRLMFATGTDGLTICVVVLASFNSSDYCATTTICRTRWYLRVAVGILKWFESRNTRVIVWQHYFANNIIY